LGALAIGAGGGGAATAPHCFGEPATIVGNANPNDITGTNGDDVIYADDGDDVIQAKRGKDLVCGADGDDEVHGGEGKDFGSGGRGEDFVDGRRGFDTDKDYGGPGNDKVLAGNYLNGGSGDDILRVISYAGDLNRDRVLGGSGDDHLRGDGGHDASTVAPTPTAAAGRAEARSPTARTDWPDQRRST
jgi:Ca2+-binding RTX toxin-like protein